MTIFYMDIVNGNDANDGSSWAQAKKTFTGANALTMTGGDELRIAKNATPITRTGLTYTHTTASGGTFSLNQAIGNQFFHCWGTVPSFTGLYAGLGYTSYGSMEYYNTLAAACSAAAIYWYSSTTIPINTKLGHISFAAVNLSSYRRLHVTWIMDGLNNTADWHLPGSPHLELWLCSDTAGLTAVHKVPLTKLNRGGSAVDFNFVDWDSGGALGSSIQSIAIYSGAAALLNTTGTAYVGISMITAVVADPLVQPQDLVWVSGLKAWMRVNAIQNPSTTPRLHLTNGNTGVAALGTGTVIILRAPSIVNTATGNYTETFNKVGVSNANRLTISGGWNTSNSTQDGYSIWQCNTGTSGKNNFYFASYSTGAVRNVNLSKLIFSYVGYAFYSSASYSIPSGDGITLSDCHFYHAGSNFYTTAGPVWSSVLIQNCSFVIQGGGYLLNHGSGSTTVTTDTTWTLDSCGFLDISLSPGNSTYATATPSQTINISNSVVYGQTHYMRVAGSPGKSGSVTFGAGNSFIGTSWTFYGANNGSYTPAYAGYTWSISGLSGSINSLTIYGGGLTFSGNITTSQSIQILSDASSTRDANLIYLNNLTLTLLGGYSCQLAGVVATGCTITTSYASNMEYLILNKYVEFINCDIGQTNTSYSFNIGFGTSVYFKATNTTFRVAKFYTRNYSPRIEMFKCSFLSNSATRRIFEPYSSDYTGSPIGTKFVNCNFPAALTLPQLGFASPKYQDLSSGVMGYDYPGVVINKDGVAGDTSYYLACGSIVMDSTVVHTAGGKSFKYQPQFPSLPRECDMHFLQVAVKAGVQASIGFWVYQVGAVRVRMVAQAFQISGNQAEIDTGISNTTDAWVYVGTTFTPDVAGVLRFRLAFECSYQASYTNHYAYIDDYNVVQ